MFLVVDCGTSYLKAALAEENALITKEVVRFALSNPENPESWVSALEKALSHFQNNDISCIALTGQGPAAVAVTKSGKAPVAVLWNSKGQNPSNPSFLPRIKALKDKYPSVYSDAMYILGAAEYLAWVLTGNACTATPVEGFEKFYTLDDSIDISLIPPFMKSGSILGKYKDASVLVPWPDFVPAIIGSGAVHPGMLCLRTGTGDGINLCTSEPVYREGFLTARHPNGKDWNLSRIIPNTGLTLANAVGNRNWAEALEDDEIYKIAVQQCNRTADAVKELRDIGITEIRVSGGLSVNPVLNRIRSNALGMPVITVGSKETGLQGLAILAYCSLNNTDIANTTEKILSLNS